jgi:copper transport protein
MVVVLIALGGGPAWAHADLVSTEPAYGAALASAPGRALLRFNYPVELDGAIVELGGQPLEGRPSYGGDHREVSVPLPRLGSGSQLLSWFLVAKDGHVMGGELAFTVGPGAVTSPGSSPPAARRSFARYSTAEDVARMVGFAGLAVLVGGVFFIVVLWPTGAGLRRTRLLLWTSLAAVLGANTVLLGLKATVLPLGVLTGTHFWRVSLYRLAFLALVVPVVALLTWAPGRALRSQHWMLAAAASALGTLATHGLLGHAYARGPLAVVADVVHLGAVAVWLGGLAVLGGVLLPRRQLDELALIVPRWSRLAFASMATAGIAGIVLMVAISPRWSGLAGSEYGRFLLLKLALVAGLLATASRARDFARRRLPTLVVPPAWGSTSEVTTLEAPVEMRPLLTAVATELYLAASILAATAILVGRPPPS